MKLLQKFDSTFLRHSVYCTSYSLLGRKVAKLSFLAAKIVWYRSLAPVLLLPERGIFYCSAPTLFIAD